jgi:hypothetical protein
VGVFAVACVDGEPEGTTFFSRDSAGVVVVESSREALPEQNRWTVAGEPYLSIGVAEGDTTQELFRVIDAARLNSDTVVIVNGGTSQVRWYDPSGRYVRAVGRRGSGPGEFSEYGPGGMCVLPGDQLLVADPVQRRANVFTSGGEFVQVVRMATAGAFPAVQGCFGDGTLLGWHALSPPERIPGTLYQPTHFWSRLTPDGAVMAELATLPANPQYLLQQEYGTVTYHTIPFTVRPSATAGGSQFYVTSGTVPVVDRRTSGGALEMILRWSQPGRVPAADVYDRFRAFTIDSQSRPERRLHWEKFFNVGVELPERVAAIRSLDVDDLGNLWAERYRLPWDSVPVWDVLDRRGAWLGSVTLPAGLQVYQIGPDFVLGLIRDSVGVERVQLHALVR